MSRVRVEGEAQLEVHSDRAVAIPRLVGREFDVFRVFHVVVDFV